MTVEERIQRCLLLEQMEENNAYTKELGLENVSTFHGYSMNDSDSSSESESGTDQ